MDATALQQYVLLHANPNITNNQRVRLLQSAGSIAGLWQLAAQTATKPSTEPELHAALRELRQWRKQAPQRELARQIDSVARLQLRVISIVDDHYPALLRAIPSPPALLYCRGDLRCLALPQLAVVGSRKASPSGLRGARELSKAVSQQGLTVTSGLAIGIDGQAHQAALSAGGTTVAVMASGLDSVYPRRHRDLAEAIAMQGCLVSEFAVGTPPRKHHFPQRNRIISGLALATLIVEAALPSGSLITAQTALAQGRDVLALPWSAYHQGGHGCLQLLQDGAGLVRNSDDILLAIAQSPLRFLCRAPEATGSKPTAAPGCPQPVMARTASADLPEHQRDLLALVGAEPTALEQLAAFSSESPSSLLASLSSLELQGLIERVGGAYVRL